VARIVAIGAIVLCLAGCDGSSLPYDEVTYGAADARRAFAGEDVKLTVRARGALATTFGNERDVLEVDVFGDPAVAKRAGFRDLEDGATTAPSPAISPSAGARTSVRF
jgi:hypothetical protein